MDAKQRVLIVDDMEINRESLNVLLKRRYDTVLAKNGEEAIQKALAQPRPDIILMDITMPVMDGYEACRRLKQDPKTADIPVIFVTALSDIDSEQKGFELGGVDYITKPYEAAKIISRVETHLKIKSQEKLLISQSRLAAMGDMVSMIAHQWRQPLTAVSMGINNILIDIKMGEADIGQLEESLEQLSSQIEELSFTIDEFRDFIKPSKELQTFPLSLPLSKAVTMLEKTLLDANIEITKELDETLLVSGYSDEILQVFLNILDNAKDAIAKKDIQKGNISLRVFKKDDDTVAVLIADNGIGFSKSEAQRLFEPYFSTKPEKSGMGLGLYIARAVIQSRHAGKISAESDGDGARFLIELPLIRKEG